MESKTGLSDVIPLLRCPICRGSLRREANSLICENRHCFDIAKSGYVTLTRASGSSGDDREMVRARTAFLDSGYYEKFSDEINKTTAEVLRDGAGDRRDIVAIDAGCGEGYYADRLSAHLDEVFGKNVTTLGFDLSKYACDHAAKRAKNSGRGEFFAVSSIYSIPVADECADVIINLFAPVAEKEFARVLKPGGYLIIGAAGKRHLYELKRAIYSEAYENEGRRDLPEGFTHISTYTVKYTFDCGERLHELFMMTPYYFKTSKEDAAKLDRIDSLDITADFDIYVYRKN